MTEAAADAMRRKFHALVDQAQDYELPPMTRLLIRLKNGVPGIKAQPCSRRRSLLRGQRQHKWERLSHNRTGARRFHAGLAAGP